ncbi:hypothetical protein [Virgibacillus sp. CBA3643]|uniref:hypothetical protein n=1 Tax=Virgibacillus sp. CBA3643 TaxID=2942278 RepID=UPI0035A392D8
MNGLLINAVEHKEKIVVFYIDAKNNVTERVIRVISIDEDTIVAYCYYRKQVRMFKLGNILAAGSVRKKNKMGA